jgi:hypothetical protein
VIALFRYTLSTVLLSQRFLPPVLVFLAFEFVFTGADDTGPLPPDYAVGTAAVFVCGLWLTVVTVNAADPVQRAITVVKAGGAARVLAASVWVAGAWCTLIALFGLLYPLVVGTHPIGPAVLVPGVPPVHPVFQMLAGTRPPDQLLLPVAAFGLVSVVLLACATLLTRFVAQRRD